MFGNILGWFISLVIAAVVVGVGYQVIEAAAPTQPTGWVKANIKPLALDEICREAVDLNDPDPAKVNLKDDAGDFYKQAIYDYNSHKDAYLPLEKPPEPGEEFDEQKLAEIEGLKGFDFLVKGAACPQMNFLSVHPEDAVGYVDRLPDLESLRGLVMAMRNSAMAAWKAKHFDVAHKFARAEEALGYHLYKERVAKIELDDAGSYLGEANALMTQVLGAEHASAKLIDVQAQLSKQRQDEFTWVQWAMGVIGAQGDESYAEHSGDMFELAMDPMADRVFRVEAIRKLGRMQFHFAKNADPVKATRLLKQLAGDSTLDSVVRTAAKEARDMNSHDNQCLR